MRKASNRILSPALVVAAILVAAAAALGDTLVGGPEGPNAPVTHTGGLHFVSGPTVFSYSGTSGKYLRATGEVAGAGRTATATLSADANVTTGCVNRGSKGTAPNGLQTTSSTTTGSEPFPTRSGRGTFVVSTAPVGVGSRTCPDRMAPVVVGVTFTKISLTITSNTGTLSATFDPLDP
jgi:hypothetical protein